MEILWILPGFILAIAIVVIYEIKLRKSQNKAYFYVARDKNKKLWLYIGKPIRKESEFGAYNRRGRIVFSSYQFKDLGLNIDDYKDLRWEDEPVEVFINMED